MAWNARSRKDSQTMQRRQCNLRHSHQQHLVLRHGPDKDRGNRSRTRKSSPSCRQYATPAIQPTAPVRIAGGNSRPEWFIKIGYIGPKKSPTKEIAMAFSTRESTSQMVNCSLCVRNISSKRVSEDVARPTQERGLRTRTQTSSRQAVRTFNLDESRS